MGQRLADEFRNDLRIIQSRIADAIEPRAKRDYIASMRCHAWQQLALCDRLERELQKDQQRVDALRRLEAEYKLLVQVALDMGNDATVDEVERLVSFLVEGIRQ